MAKQKPKKRNVPQQSNEQTIEEKNPGFFQKLFFWVIIPLLFVSAVLLIVAEVSGINVFEKAKNMTISSSQDKEENLTKRNSQNEKQIADLKAQLQEKEAEIAKMQGEIEDANSTTSKMSIEKHRLEVQLKKAENNKSETTKEFGDIVTTYEKMAPKSAAPVITNMKDKDALKILTNLKPDTLAAILEKMPADKAAHYTSLLSKN